MMRHALPLAVALLAAACSSSPESAPTTGGPRIEMIRIAAGTCRAGGRAPFGHIDRSAGGTSIRGDVRAIAPTERLARCHGGAHVEHTLTFDNSRHTLLSNVKVSRGVRCPRPGPTSCREPSICSS